MDQPSFHTKGAPVGKPTGPLKPGQYWWKPGLSPRGPVVVLVSLPQQTMHVCIATAFSSAARASAAAARATPRRRGYSTFSRRRKRITRKSMIMPRCRTCSGSPGLASPCTLASCPGYPASHGCIRLPYDFSALLFDATSKGGTVAPLTPD